MKLKTVDTCLNCLSSYYIENHEGKILNCKRHDCEAGETEVCDDYERDVYYIARYKLIDIGIIDKFFKTKEGLIKYLGFNTDDVEVTPILDYREYYWSVDESCVMTSESDDMDDEVECNMDDRVDMDSFTAISTLIEDIDSIIILDNNKEVKNDS